jgi:mono/diheme cytochrome c family protein
MRLLPWQSGEYAVSIEEVDMKAIPTLRLTAVAALLAPAIGLGLAVNAALAADAAPIYSTAVGKATYATYCASCHGVDLRGKGEVAATLSSKPTDLTRLAAKNDGVFPAEKRMLSGHRRPRRGGGRTAAREMPVWGELFLWPEGDSPERRAHVERKIGELVAYLQSVQDPAEKR